MKHTDTRINSMLARLVSLLLVLAMMLPLMPAAMAEEPIGYGYINLDKVRLRKQMSREDNYALLPLNWVCELYQSTAYGTQPYYYVKTNIPKALDREYYGYVQSQFITIMSAGEVAAWQAKGGNGGTATVPPSAEIPSTTPPSSVTDSNYVTAAAGTNYYTYSGGTLTSQGLLATNQAYFVSATAAIGGVRYYVITVNGGSYYAPAAALTFVNGGNDPATPVPTGSTEMGTLKIKLSGKTNMRSSAAETSTNIIAKLNQGTVLPYYSAVESGSHTWYLCFDSSSNQYGYIVDYCVTILTNNITPTPSPVPGTPGNVKGYIEITPDGKTNIRRAAQTGVNNVVIQVEKGTVLPYYSTETINKELWYYVYSAAANAYGYVLGSCAKITSKEGQTPAPITAVPGAGYIKLTYDSVNLRKSTSTDSKQLGQYGKGSIMQLLGVTEVKGEKWYNVYYLGKTGYVMAKFAVECDAKGNTGGGDDPLVSSGYVYTTADKVYVRKSASGTAGVYGQVPNANTVLKIVGKAVKNGSVIWYNVEYEGNKGYIHGNYVSVMTPEQIEAYEKNGIIIPPAPTPTPVPKAVNMIQTTLDKVYIRQAASTDAGYYGQAKLGAVFQYSDITTVGSKKWYKIKFEGVDAYILGSCVKVMTDAEYIAYLNSLPTATPVPTASPTPNLADMSSTALTNIEKVVLRSAPAGSEVSVIYAGGTVLTLQGETAKAVQNKVEYTWLKVKVGSAVGWVRSDLVRILTKTQAEMYVKTGDPDAKPEATYVSLSMGATGTAVQTLQAKLVEKGYLKAGTYTYGTYDTATKSAVIAFQTAEGLYVDGVAGSKTQHALYGTVETGYYDNGAGPGTTTLYTPELKDWFKSDIQSIFKKGYVAVVTDVKTGISWKIKRWSGGNHADVEPLTAADTAKMCRVYNVKVAQDIYDKNLYQRRAVLVTIGTHSYCGSMYGCPHNYPEGDTIDDNDFYGQFCIHFVNSMTHGTKENPAHVDKDHQTAITYAYNNAVSLLTGFGYTFK